MQFLNFQFDILFTKKVLKFKKINAIEIEVGNVGIGKNRISIIECMRIKQLNNQKKRRKHNLHVIIDEIKVPVLLEDV